MHNNSINGVHHLKRPAGSPPPPRRFSGHVVGGGYHQTFTWRTNMLCLVFIGGGNKRYRSPSAQFKVSSKVRETPLEPLPILH